MSYSNRISLRTRLMNALVLIAIFQFSVANAALVTNPNDPRNWLGATVGTFAQLFYGADTQANRELVVDFANGGVNSLLDDGLFGFAGATPATMISTVGVGSTGRSLDTTGTGSFAYTLTADSPASAGNFIDDLWLQTDNVIGHAVWDLGAPSTKAAIFNTIDHGPLPQEAIEATVYLSNDPTFAPGTYTQAVTERVWLEGYHPILGINWDGFAYAVGTGTGDSFRYASIIWGGPGALIADGDNEINGIMGLDSDFTPSVIPVPAAVWLFATGVLGLLGLGRRKATA